MNNSVSILSNPEGLLQRRVWPVDRRFAHHVSILSNPEGLLQPVDDIPPANNEHVSILSNPEGLLQHDRYVVGYPDPSEFQSSATPKGCCNDLASVGIYAPGLFQSSATPKGCCNLVMCPTSKEVDNVSILSNPEGLLQHLYRLSIFDHLCFNPQQPRRAAATACFFSPPPWSSGFNPQQPRRAAATIYHTKV